MNKDSEINEKFYKQATEEYDSDVIDDSIMSKSLSLSGGDEEKAKEYFETQQKMKTSMTKSYILNYDFSSVRSREFVNDYVQVLKSLGMPD